MAAGGARSFNGSTDEINTASYTWPVSSGVSMAAWVYIASLPGSGLYYGVATQKVNTGSQDFYLLFVENSGGSLKAAYYYSSSIGSGPSRAVDPGSGTLALNTWNHLAWTYDNTNGFKTYLNGISDGTSTAAGAPAGSANAMPMGIGWDAFNANRWLNGRVADVAQWTESLTASEAAALAKGARPPKIRPSSLFRWWPLDGLQSPEPDLSGNANSGTVTGTALAAGPPIDVFTRRNGTLLAPAARTPFLFTPAIIP